MSLASNLNRRIVFQIYDSNAKDSEGFPLPDTKKWLDFKTVWAMIKTLRGSEFYQAASMQAENTTRFVIRYTKGLNTNMRIQYDNRFFDIQSIINDDERNVTLTIIAKEVV